MKYIAKILSFIFLECLTILLNFGITYLFIWMISLCFDFTCTLKLVVGIYLITCLLRFRFFVKTEAKLERINK